MMAPVKACVVEIGNPVSVARITVSPAPAATARTKYSEPTNWSGTIPLPLNFFSSVCARKIDVIDPAKVVIVAHEIAVR